MPRYIRVRGPNGVEQGTVEDGRVGQPEEVAALICWLASEDMSFSTGATFDISGGRATF